MSLHQSAPAADAGPSAELEAIGRRMLAGLNGMRVLSLSLHDERGDILWLNESVMGPDEHEAVRTALEAFAGEGTPARHEHDLGDGRIAVCLRTSLPGGPVLGLAMVIVDAKSLNSRGTADRVDPFQDLLDPLDSLAGWLAEDVSATQTRLKALPEFAASQPDRVPPDADASVLLEPSATPAASADREVDPALDRHFAALRALPLLLYTQRLEPMTPGSRIRRFEILLRTNSEHGRTHAPVAMLDAAVKRGLGSVIDRRVVTELVTWLARHPDAWRSDPLLISINLSPSALADDHFLKFLELCLDKSGLPRGMLAFELDSGICTQQMKRTDHLSQMLAAFGCSLIIDDFTFRDPLLDLLSLKGLRMLKLHAALTTDLSRDKRRQAIVAGIAQTARVLGMHTCAKRIETMSDRRWLVALKVDFAQGYAFSEPAPLAQLAVPQ